MTTRSSKAEKADEKPTADPAPLPGAGLGRVAYEAYSAVVDGKSVRGEALPSWDEQVEKTPDVAAAWCAAAQAVLTATFSRKES